MRGNAHTQPFPSCQIEVHWVGTDWRLAVLNTPFLNDLSTAAIESAVVAVWILGCADRC